MAHLLVIGGASIDTLHFAGQEVVSAGGAGMYTAMAAHRGGIKVSMLSPRPEPIPEALHPVAESLSGWLGPLIPPEELAHFEIVHQGGETIYLKASLGAEASLAPDALPQDLSIYDCVHITPLLDAQRQLAFLDACRQRGAKRISAGTFVDVIADGKVYLSTTEHSPNTPLYKDALFRCINATTGEEIWTLMGYATNMYGGTDLIADGFFAFLNCYDMQIYCVGKGPSALTVTAPDVGVEVGKSVVIRGTVTDIAAGTQQNEQAARFPNGVPAVSDASMRDWMEYVYMQKPKPADATGVPVSIDVIDSNGNYRNVGTAISDASGSFTLTWQPDIEGNYTVIATFAGSESYWPSSAETSFAADPAPAATPEPTPMPTSNTEMYVMGFGIAMIIAIAVVGALLLMMLRRRP